MIPAPSRPIEGWLSPDADRDASGGQHAGSGDAGVAIVQTGLIPFCAAILPNIAIDLPDTADQQRAIFPDIGAGSPNCDPVPGASACISFRQDPDGECLPGPNLLSASRLCATNDPEYLEIFGPSGSVQRCKEQFIESGFSPRKPLRLDPTSFWRDDTAKSVHGPTDVCVIWVYQNSRAA